MVSSAERYSAAFRRSLGSPEAVKAHDAVIDALQHFAGVTDGLPGSNVIDHFKSVSAKAEAAGYAAVKEAKHGQDPA